MAKKPDLLGAYRDERQRERGMSDAERKQRRADLAATIERTEREYIANLKESVARGAMTAQEADGEFDRFQRQLRELKVPFGPH